MCVEDGSVGKHPTEMALEWEAETFDNSGKVDFESEDSNGDEEVQQKGIEAIRQLLSAHQK